MRRLRNRVAALETLTSFLQDGFAEALVQRLKAGHGEQSYAPYIRRREATDMYPGTTTYQQALLYCHEVSSAIRVTEALVDRFLTRLNVGEWEALPAQGLVTGLCELFYGISELNDRAAELCDEGFRIVPRPAAVRDGGAGDLAGVVDGRDDVLTHGSPSVVDALRVEEVDGSAPADPSTAGAAS